MRAHASQQKIYLFFGIMAHKKGSAHHCTHIAKLKLRTHPAPSHYIPHSDTCVFAAVGRALFISVLLIFCARTQLAKCLHLLRLQHPPFRIYGFPEYETNEGT